MEGVFVGLYLVVGLVIGSLLTAYILEVLVPPARKHRISLWHDAVVFPYVCGIVAMGLWPLVLVIAILYVLVLIMRGFVRNTFGVDK